MRKDGICPHQGAPWETLQARLPEEGPGLRNSWQEAGDVPGPSVADLEEASSETLFNLNSPAASSHPHLKSCQQGPLRPGFLSRVPDPAASSTALAAPPSVVTGASRRWAEEGRDQASTPAFPGAEGPLSSAASSQKVHLQEALQKLP